ncbi:YcxB family protein [Actinacidiphila glaucinigra]|uniref:YcxB family protein n=1 Tax=Actinacidiphila glaucinigra TaxID=235986 RepID=UPI0034049BF7
MTNDMHTTNPGTAGQAGDGVRAVEFTWTPGRDDIAEVLGAQRRRLELWRGPLFFAAVTVAVVAGLREFAPGAADIVGLAAAGGVGTLTSLAGGVFDRRRQLRNATAHARAQGECTMRVDDDGVRAASALTEFKVPWTSLTHYVETPRLFLLVHDDGMGSMSLLPKRGGDGGPEAEGLRALVTRHLGPRPRDVSGARPEGARRGRRG